MDRRGRGRSSRAGQSLIVPAGRLHGFRNAGTGTLHVHAVLASPIFEAMPEGASEATRRWTTRSKRFPMGTMTSEIISPACRCRKRPIVLSMSAGSDRREIERRRPCDS